MYSTLLCSCLGSVAFIFGGFNNGRMNDLWMWDSSVFQWTFVSGSLQTRAILPTSTDPGSRNRATLHFVQNPSNPANGTVFIFGGSTGNSIEARSDVFNLQVQYTVPVIPCKPPAPAYSLEPPGCNVRTRQWIVNSLPTEQNATVIIPTGGVVVLSNITISANTSINIALGDVVSSSKCVTLTGGTLVIVSQEILSNGESAFHPE
jgi:hypothetical protein